MRAGLGAGRHQTTAGGWRDILPKDPPLAVAVGAHEPGCILAALCPSIEATPRRPDRRRHAPHTALPAVTIAVRARGRDGHGNVVNAIHGRR